MSTKKSETDRVLGRIDERIRLFGQLLDKGCAKPRLRARPGYQKSVRRYFDEFHGLHSPLVETQEKVPESKQHPTLIEAFGHFNEARDVFIKRAYGKPYALLKPAEKSGVWDMILAAIGRGLEVLGIEP